MRAAPLFAAGAATLIWQVASLRSLLEGLRGNELGLGLLLTVWLLLIGLGSWLGSLWAAAGRAGSPRSLEPGLLLLLLLAPAALLGSLLLQSGPTLADPAQLAGPARMAGLAALGLVPACLTLGAVFALAARAPQGLAPGAWAAAVFAVESLGTVVAGLLFHYLLASTSQRSAALVSAVLCWLAALPLIRRGKPVHLIPAALLGGLALLYLVPGLELPGSQQLRRQIPGYQMLAHENSPHAALSVLQRGDQRLFTANGQVVFTDQDQQQIETLIHLPLLAHPAPRRVLLVGGGLGGGLREALKHQPERLDYVELDPALVALARRYLPELAGVLADRRLQLRLGDGRLLLSRTAPSTYDVILIRLPGPSSALMNRFYTSELFRSARRVLRPGGLLSLDLEGGEGYLGPATLIAHRGVLGAMREAGLQPLPLPGQPTLLLGGRDQTPRLPAPALLGRFQERQLQTRFLGRGDLLLRVLPFKRQLYEETLRTAPGPVRLNRDLHPAAYFEASLLWLSLGSPGLANAVLRVGEQAWRWPWLVPLLGLLLFAGLAALRRRRPAAGLVLFAAGAAGLALELSALLACQLARGVIHRELGILLASFMLGLAGGALAGRWLLAATPRWALTLATGALAGAALLGLALLPLALAHPGLALAALLLQLLLVGACVGACYPPAAAVLAGRHGAGASARAYVWDLAGAGLGALLAGGLALPVLGLPGTGLLCAAICLGCALGLRRGL